MIVVEISGGVRRLDPPLEDIATTTERTIVVHGAGRRSTTSPHVWAARHGWSNGARRGDQIHRRDHHGPFLMAYAGRANKRMVERLRQLGVNAFGMCGLDGGLIRATAPRPAHSRERPHQGAAR